MFDTTPVTVGQARSIAVEVMQQEVKPIVFENEQLKEQLRQINEGERVVLPKDKEHAKFMLIVAMNYLGIKPGESFSYGEQNEQSN